MSDYILIPRVKDTAPEFVIFGSQVVRCNSCAEDCWIAPSSILVMRSKPILKDRKLCHPCADRFTRFSIEKALERVPAKDRDRVRHELEAKIKASRRQG